MSVVPMAIAVTHVYRDRVKRLSGEPLAHVDLTPGEGLPHDRRFAMASGTTQFDPAKERYFDFSRLFGASVRVAAIRCSRSAMTVGSMISKSASKRMA
ncbi:MAG: hypothetical protein V3U18_05170 [Alphaproteobacteria bacterium]